MAALFVPAGVKLAVPFVGGFAGHAIVPAGVKLTVELLPRGVSVPVAVEPVSVAADTPLEDDVNSLCVLPEVASASVPAPSAGTVVAEPVNVSAGTVPDVPVKAGTFAG